MMWCSVPHLSARPLSIAAYVVSLLDSAQLVLLHRRYSKVKQGFVGPWREGREAMKSQLFRLLQKRGFRLFFRHRACEAPSEPAYLERWLLEQLDWAGNERNNGGYRQLMLPPGMGDLGSLPQHVCL
jgi:hypothetical protein